MVVQPSRLVRRFAPSFGLMVASFVLALVAAYDNTAASTTQRAELAALGATLDDQGHASPRSVALIEPQGQAALAPAARRGAAPTPVLDRALHAVHLRGWRHEIRIEASKARLHSWGLAGQRAAESPTWATLPQQGPPRA